MNKPKPEPFLLKLPTLDPYSAIPRRVVKPTYGHMILLFVLAVCALSACIAIVIGNP